MKVTIWWNKLLIEKIKTFVNNLNAQMIEQFLMHKKM